MEAMKAYVEEEDTCRQAFLLDYFGEKEAEDCGRCDVCRARRGKPADRAARLRNWIRDRKGKYSIKTLRDAFDNPSSGLSGDYLSLLREMIDAGTVPPPES